MRDWASVFFAKGVSKMTRTCAKCYDFVKTWKGSDSAATIQSYLEETIIVLGLQHHGL